MSMRQDYKQDNEQEYDCYVVAVVKVEASARSGAEAKDIAVGIVRKKLREIDTEPFIPRATVVEKGLTGEELAEMIKRMRKGLES